MECTMLLNFCWLDWTMTINNYVHYVGHLCARNESLSISFESFRNAPLIILFPRPTTDLIAILLLLRALPFAYIHLFFQSKQGKYTYRSLSWSRAYRMIASGLHRFVLRQTMVSFHIINFLIKDHPSRGPGIQSRWRFPAAKAHLPVKRPFRRPGLLFRRRFCGQGPPSFKKTTVLLRFYKWPGSYPDEGFVANAHLPYE